MNNPVFITCSQFKLIHQCRPQQHVIYTGWLTTRHPTQYVILEPIFLQVTQPAVLEY